MCQHVVSGVNASNSCKRSSSTARAPIHQPEAMCSGGVPSAVSSSVGFPTVESDTTNGQSVEFQTPVGSRATASQCAASQDVLLHMHPGECLEQTAVPPPSPAEPPSPAPGVPSRSSASAWRNRRRSPVPSGPADPPSPKSSLPSSNVPSGCASSGAASTTTATQPPHKRPLVSPWKDDRQGRGLEADASQCRASPSRPEEQRALPASRMWLEMEQGNVPLASDTTGTDHCVSSAVPTDHCATSAIPTDHFASSAVPTDWSLSI